MKIERTDLRGECETTTIEELIRDTIYYTDDQDLIHVLTEILGKLIDKLADKGVLSMDEAATMIGSPVAEDVHQIEDQPED